MKLGAHCISTWSGTQHLVAKSSAEAELYASVRAACEALGVQTLVKDLGQGMAAGVQIDASAAKHIRNRKRRTREDPSQRCRRDVDPRARSAQKIGTV